MRSGGRWVLVRAGRRLRLVDHWLVRGELDEAAHDAERALRLVRRCRPVPALLLAEVTLRLARIERDRDAAAACLAHLQTTVGALESAPATPRRDALLARTLIDLADCHRRAGRYPAATAAVEAALRRVAPGGPLAAVLLTAALTTLGIIAKELGRYDDAERWYARVGEIHKLAGARPADAAALAHNLAGLDHARRRYPAAEEHARRAVQLRRSVPGVTAVDVALDLAVLGAALAGQQRHDEARDLFEQTLAAYRAARPPRRYEIAVQLHNLADLAQSAGHLSDAERHYRDALQIKQDLLGAEHPEVGVLANNLGTLLADQQRPAEAASCYRRALAIASRAYPADHPVLTAVRRNLDRLGAAR